VGFRFRVASYETHCFFKRNDYVIVVVEEFHVLGKKFSGGVDPKIRMTSFRLIGDAMVH
jgi:hypothetical protein